MRIFFNLIIKYMNVLQDDFAKNPAIDMILINFTVLSKLDRNHEYLTEYS